MQKHILVVHRRMLVNVTVNHHDGRESMSPKTSIFISVKQMTSSSHAQLNKGTVEMTENVFRYFFMSLENERSIFRRVENIQLAALRLVIHY